MTQQELSESCGWEHQSRVSGYERMGKKGGREPSSEDAAAIAGALHVSLAWLLTGEGSMEPGASISASAQQGQQAAADITTAGSDAVDSDRYADLDEEYELLTGFRSLNPGGQLRVRAALADEMRKESFERSGTFAPVPSPIIKGGMSVQEAAREMVIQQETEKLEQNVEHKREEFEKAGPAAIAAGRKKQLRDKAEKENAKKKGADKETGEQTTRKD